jgi:hypothetical protein
VLRPSHDASLRSFAGGGIAQDGKPGLPISGCDGRRTRSNSNRRCTGPCTGQNSNAAWQHGSHTRTGVSACARSLSPLRRRANNTPDSRREARSMYVPRKSGQRRGAGPHLRLATSIRDCWRKNVTPAGGAQMYRDESSTPTMPTSEIESRPWPETVELPRGSSPASKGQ